MLTEKILLNQAIKNATENMKTTVNYNYLFIYSSTNTCDKSLNNRLSKCKKDYAKDNKWNKQSSRILPNLVTASKIIIMPTKTPKLSMQREESQGEVNMQGSRRELRTLQTSCGKEEGKVRNKK